MQKSFIFEKGICYYGSSIPEFLESNVNCPEMLHFGSDDKNSNRIYRKSKKIHKYE